MNLVLRRIQIDDEAGIKAAVDELETEGGRWSMRYRGDLSWPDYVALVHARESGADPAEAAHAELVADVDGVIVGRSTIRFVLDDFHWTLGGHIGYLVRPQFRGRGFATEMLRQSVEILRARDISPVLVTCDDDNLASAKVIVANGGVLEGVVPGVADMPKRRYWIS